MNWMSRLTLNERLALTAFLLGAGAIVAQPTVGAAVRISPQELAVVVQRGADRVAPLDLANWIVEGRSDYRLIDLREESEYGRYHIPMAENIPLTSLPAAEIAPTEKVLVYADDGARSSQGWFLLHARGLKGAYMLDGGLDGWKESVLFPIIAEGASQPSRAKLQAISRHFGGTPRLAGPGTAATAIPLDAAASAFSMPPPPPPAASGAPRPRPKRKEGC